jgi:hypothetical protein
MNLFDTKLWNNLPVCFINEVLEVSHDSFSEMSMWSGARIFIAISDGQASEFGIQFNLREVCAGKTHKILCQVEKEKTLKLIKVTEIEVTCNNTRNQTGSMLTLINSTISFSPCHICHSILISTRLPTNQILNGDGCFYL